MKAKSVILDSQKTIYVVTMFGNSELEDIHSFWTDKKKAEETLEFVRQVYDEAYIEEYSCNQKIIEEVGYEITIGINSIIPIEIMMSASGENIFQINIKNTITEIQIKELLESHPDIPGKVMLDQNFRPSASSSNFTLNYHLYKSLNKKDDNWVIKNTYAKLTPEITAWDITPVKSFERALIYRKEVIRIFNNLPERICEDCKKKISKGYLIGYKDKNSTVVLPIRLGNNFIQHDYVWACSKNCYKKQKQLCNIPESESDTNGMF